MTRNPMVVAIAIFLNSLASGFVQRLRRRRESAAKRLAGARAASREVEGTSVDGAPVEGVERAIEKVGRVGEEKRRGKEERIIQPRRAMREKEKRIFPTHRRNY